MAQERIYKEFLQNLINKVEYKNGRHNPATRALVAAIVRHGVRVYNYIPQYLISPAQRPASYACKECGDERDVDFPCDTIQDIARELGVSLP